jgi:hypothetical protein
MVKFSSVHSSQGFDRRRQRMGRSFVSRNLRHINLDIETVRAPVVSQVGLAAGRDLNSRDPSSGVLLSGVESTTRMVSFVKCPSPTLITSGTMTNSKNLAKASTLRLHPKVLMIQINLDISRKDVGES